MPSPASSPSASPPEFPSPSPSPYPSSSPSPSPSPDASSLSPLLAYVTEYGTGVVSVCRVRPNVQGGAGAAQLVNCTPSAGAFPGVSGIAFAPSPICSSIAYLGSVDFGGNLWRCAVSAGAPASGAQGNLDSGNCTELRFNTTFTSPESVVFHGTRAYVIDHGSSWVAVCNQGPGVSLDDCILSSGSGINVFGVASNGAPLFKEVSAIAFHADVAYITDMRLGVVWVCTETATLGNCAPSSASGLLHDPQGIAFAHNSAYISTGNAVVVCVVGGNIDAPVLVDCSANDAGGLIAFPLGITFQDGAAYIAMYQSNGSVLVCSDGASLANCSHVHGFSYPVAIAFHTPFPGGRAPGCTHDGLGPSPSPSPSNSPCPGYLVDAPTLACAPPGSAGYNLSLSIANNVVPFGTGCTTEGPVTTHYTQAYTVTIPAEGNVTVDIVSAPELADGMPLDTVLGVWPADPTSCPLASPPAVCNDDTNNGACLSRLQFSAPAGASYYLLVGHYNDVDNHNVSQAAGSPFTMKIESPACISPSASLSPSPEPLPSPSPEPSPSPSPEPSPSPVASPSPSPSPSAPLAPLSLQRAYITQGDSSIISVCDVRQNVPGAAGAAELVNCAASAADFPGAHGIAFAPPELCNSTVYVGSRSLAVLRLCAVFADAPGGGVPGMIDARNCTEWRYNTTFNSPAPATFHGNKAYVIHYGSSQVAICSQGVSLSDCVTSSGGGIGGPVVFRKVSAIAFNNDVAYITDFGPGSGVVWMCTDTATLSGCIPSLAGGLLGGGVQGIAFAGSSAYIVDERIRGVIVCTLEGTSTPALGNCSLNPAQGVTSATSIVFHDSAAYITSPGSLGNRVWVCQGGSSLANCTSSDGFDGQPSAIAFHQPVHWAPTERRLPGAPGLLETVGTPNETSWEARWKKSTSGWPLESYNLRCFKGRAPGGCSAPDPAATANIASGLETGVVLGLRPATRYVCFVAASNDGGQSFECSAGVTVETAPGNTVGCLGFCGGRNDAEDCECNYLGQQQGTACLNMPSVCGGKGCSGATLLPPALPGFCGGINPYGLQTLDAAGERACSCAKGCANDDANCCDDFKDVCGGIADWGDGGIIAPSAPYAIAAARVTPNSVASTWSDVQGAPLGTQYLFKCVDAGDSCDSTNYAGMPANVYGCAATVTGLESSTQYNCYAQAFDPNQRTLGNCSEALVVTTPPPAPSTLLATLLAQPPGAVEAGQWLGACNSGATVSGCTLQAVPGGSGRLLDVRVMGGKAYFLDGDAIHLCAMSTQGQLISCDRISVQGMLSNATGNPTRGFDISSGTVLIADFDSNGASAGTGGGILVCNLVQYALDPVTLANCSRSLGVARGSTVAGGVFKTPTKITIAPGGSTVYVVNVDRDDPEASNVIICTLTPPTPGSTTTAHLSDCRPDQGLPPNSLPSSVAVWDGRAYVTLLSSDGRGSVAGSVAVCTNLPELGNCTMSPGLSAANPDDLMQLPDDIPTPDRDSPIFAFQESSMVDGIAFFNGVAYAATLTHDGTPLVAICYDAITVSACTFAPGPLGAATGSLAFVDPGAFVY